MQASTARTRAIRREADLLEALGQGRLKRSRSRSRVPEDALVHEAVKRARDGDDDALRLLYLRYAGNVYSYVRAIIPDEYEAEDITQTVFARLSQRLQRYEPRRVPFGAWITTVAHNATIDHLRAKRMVPCEQALETETAYDDVARDRLAAIRAALSELTQPQREVLVLRFVLGMGIKEVAEKLGRTEQAIDALQHRARGRLREELTRLEAAPSAAKPART
jgi:RNA polymerase sigma-70 factor, ECF subfamily